jgi:hypothetical protein
VHIRFGVNWQGALKQKGKKQGLAVFYLALPVQLNIQ